jgi:putative hydrolase of the HAD superfamily
MLKAVLFDFGGTLAFRASKPVEPLSEDAFRMAPDADVVLRELSRKFKLGIVSNTSTWGEREMRGSLREMGLEDYFDTVVTSVDVGSEKPSPEIFEETVRRLGVKATECVVVGNQTDADVLGGNSLGMKTVYISWRPRPEKEVDKELQKPDHTVNRLASLLSLLT